MTATDIMNIVDKVFTDAFFVILFARIVWVGTAHFLPGEP